MNCRKIVSAAAEPLTIGIPAAALAWLEVYGHPNNYLASLAPQAIIAYTGGQSLVNAVEATGKRLPWYGKAAVFTAGALGGETLYKGWEHLHDVVTFLPQGGFASEGRLSDIPVVTAAATLASYVWQGAKSLGKRSENRDNESKRR